MGQTKWQRGKEPSHTRIYRRQLDSAAWKHLSGSAVKVLLDLASLERGKNNGEIFYSSRFGADRTGLARNTVWQALRDLIDLGFIYCTQKGGFSRKTPHAAVYGLTWAAGPKGSEWRAPSHAYEDWKPPENENTRSQFLNAAVPKSGQLVETDPVTVTDIATANQEKPLVSAKPNCPDIATQTSNQGIGEAGPETQARKQANSTGGHFQDKLRNRLTEHLSGCEPGEQTRLADDLRIPGGTLSKFMNGKKLPEQHEPALAAVFGM